MTSSNHDDERAGRSRSSQRRRTPLKTHACLQATPTFSPNAVPERGRTTMDAPRASTRLQRSVSRCDDVE
eukprot:COSAG06_NODE_54040_length_296_cov_1.837563_1_plen_69_part_10